MTATRRDHLVKRGLWLAALTITWNVIEAVVAIGAGLAAGSLALVAFGFDSIIEVLSAFVVVWQFRGELRGGYDEERERKALKAIAVTFFVLATYVVFEAARDLFFADGEADESTVGIVLAALSLAVMPTLAVAKRRTAVALGSPTLRADAQETFLCAWLVRRAPRRPRPQRSPRLVVGRLPRRARHRRPRRQGRPRSLGRRPMR